MEDGSQPFIDPLLGTTVGSYTVEERIGEGGMAVVYRARDKQSGWPVALKVYQRAWAGDSKLVHRFVREARIASSIKNPHTVVIHDFGEAEGGILFIAMELLEGRTLRELLAARKRLPPPLATEIAAQVCLSLIDAHGRGVIHRDLKPDNVFLGLANDGTLVAKVLDYGVARVVAPDSAVPAYTVLTQIGTILGTPAYMAPEQARAEEVDARTDLYSLGVILFEMLEGRPPFFEKNPLRLLEKQKTEPAPVAESVPAPLAELLRRMLAKAPDERPASAREVLAILQPFHLSASAAERTVAESELFDAPRPRGSSGPDTEREEARTSPRISASAATVEAPAAARSGLIAPTRAERPRPPGLAAPPALDVAPAVPAMPRPTARSSRTGPVAAALILALGVAASIAIAWSQRSALGPRAVPPTRPSHEAPAHRPSSELPAPPRPPARPPTPAAPEVPATPRAPATPSVEAPDAAAPVPPSAEATGPSASWSGSFRTQEGFLRLTQSGDRVTGLFGRPGRMGRLWGRVEGEAIELRWQRRSADGTSDEQGRGRIRRGVGADGRPRLTVSLGTGESVTGAAAWTALPAP